MKTKILILLTVISVFSIIWVSEGICQIGFGKPIIGIMNVDQHPYFKKGVYFSINIRNTNIQAIGGVKRIYAYNLDDPTKVYEIPLTPAVTANLIGEWGIEDEFTGQHGIYRVAVKKFDQLGNLIFPYPYVDTDDLPQGLTPIPTPQNLTVSFESGPTTPTLSLDPVEIPGVYYSLRIYDKDFTRQIYSVRVNYPDLPSVTFPAGRNPPPNMYWGTTAEDLVPGEKYIFRVNIFKDLPCSGCLLPYNQLLSTNLIEFKIPKK